MLTPITFTRHQPNLIQTLVVGVGLFLITVVSFAQNQTRPDPTVFTVVEQPPEFPGGFPAIRDYLTKNAQYPPAASIAKIKGRVVVSFIVEPDGHLTDVNVLIGLGYGCDQEAIRAVSVMPLWKPGSQSGRALRVRYNLPVLFGVDYPQDYARPKRH